MKKHKNKWQDGECRCLYSEAEVAFWGFHECPNEGWGGGFCAFAFLIWMFVGAVAAQVLYNHPYIGYAYLALLPILMLLKSTTRHN